MKRTILFFAGALWLLMQAACVKDNSVVQLQPVDSIYISGIGTTYAVSIDEQLNISPAIKTGFTPEDNLEYLWYAFNTTTQFAADTLSKEKDLAVTMAMAPGSYTLIYKVTNKSTGVFYKASTTLNVVNDYTSGIIVLTETGGKAGIHFLNTVSGRFIEDAYEKGNEGEAPGSAPVAVAYYPQRFSMPSEIVMLCADERGGVIINPVTFKKSREIRNSFIVPWEAAGTIHAQQYVPRQNGLQDYLIVNGQLHNRATNAGELLFRPAMLGNYDLSPFYFNEGATRSGFYDNLNMRFLCHNNTSGSLNPFLSGTTASIIDPNNVGLKLVSSGVVAANEYFGVFEDAGKTTRSLLRFRLNSLAQTFIAREKFVPDAEKIMQAKRFASSIALPNYLLYSTGGDIYAYNILSRSGGLLMSLGSGYDITFMELNGEELKVGYTNAALAGKKGGFATYNISTLGGIHATQTRNKAGFCDRVVSMADKQ